jgi:hypothetical protein
MADLTQAEADLLLAMEKHHIEPDTYEFPFGGQELEIPLVSADRDEAFLLDIYRGRLKLSKMKFQNRARQSIVLARLDLDGAPHRNPDGEEMACSHLHIYRAGFGHKWAREVRVGTVFADLSDPMQTLNDFVRFCNITIPPILNSRLVL